jgi:hypothetical protein
MRLLTGVGVSVPPFCAFFNFPLESPWRIRNGEFAIQELGGTGRVENVKVMWNHCLVDIGRSLHGDRFEAELLVKMTARLYAPGAEAELLAIFKSSKAQTTRKNGFLFKYTYDGGPTIADRLLTITKL